VNIALIAVIVVYIGLQILDVVSTVKALRLPQRREVNPIVRFFMARTGSALAGLLLVKLLAAPIVIAAALIVKPAIVAIAGIAALDIFYAWLVRRNFLLASI